MFKNLAIFSLTTAMFGAGSVAVAHTGVKDQGTEGKTLYTALTIGHGCTSATNSTPLPVIAQSVLFPNRWDAQKFKVAVDGTETVITDLSKHITGSIAALSFKGIKDLSLFKNSRSIVTTSGVVRGIQLTGASLDPDMIGLAPFRMSGVKFEPASCAKSLKVRMAIANWCNTSQDVADGRRVDLWFGQMTTKFNDPGVMPHENTEVYWPTLTINRDLVANPLPAYCGTGFDLAVQPSASDIDANLGIKGYWPIAP
jgi:hypothetical protein